jgi:hypothetical protein
MATGNTTSFCRSEIMAAAPSRIGHAHPAPFMVNAILPCADLARRRFLPSSCRAEWSRAKRAFRVHGPASGQASSRSGALGTTTGFSTCPHRRHSRRASIFTMFMPHFGHGGRTSKQVNGCSLSGGSFARSVGKPDRSSGGCGQRLPSRRTAQWIASLPIILYFYFIFLLSLSAARNRGEHLVLNN